jgi:hypothetical protein
MAPCARQTGAKLSMQEIINTFKKDRIMINADTVLASQNCSPAVQFERFRTEKICSRQQNRYIARHVALYDARLIRR